MKKKLYFGMVLIVFSFTASCAKFKEKFALPTEPTAVRSACATPRINRAFLFHNDAKASLALFYAERDANLLFEALYSASDSVRMASSVGKCWDRRRNHYFAMKNVISMNTQLRRILELNMRDSDPMNMILIYGGQYDEVMPNDIK